MEWQQAAKEESDLLLKRILEIPKEEWGDGPWKKDPDYEFFEYRDHKCVVRRGPFGAYNGYVEVKKDHPWFDVHYDDIDVDVHWGLSFSGRLFLCLPDHFIGFDCAHADDYCPIMAAHFKKTMPEGMFASGSFMRGTYKDIEFVMGQCVSLVDQMIKVKE